MDNKQIKELMAAMVRCGTTKLHLKKGGFELTLERASGETGPLVGSIEDVDSAQSRFQHHSPRVNAPLPANSAIPPALHAVEVKKEVAGTYITSPMVGTFYSSPSPDDPTFVKPGDKIEKGTVVCIVEAMKVMNEIKAQASGTIVEVLVESGSPVEFGTKLFRIE